MTDKKQQAGSGKGKKRATPTGGRLKSLTSRAKEETDPVWRNWFLEVDRRRQALHDHQDSPAIACTYEKDGRELQIVRQKSEPTQLKKLLTVDKKKTGSKITQDLLWIRTAWPNVVGQEIAGETEVYAFKDGVLTISVFSSVLLQELRQFNGEAIQVDLRDTWQASIPLLRVEYRLGRKKIEPALPSLYIHIPFCLSRCGYCAFVSGVYDVDAADRYLSALQNEITVRGAEGKQFETLFIGGGTPSCLSVRQLETLMMMLPAIRGEATCEMNPDSVTREKLRLLRDGGINRVSFGVQTFSEEGLRLLGRRHDQQAAAQAVAWAHEVGFPRGVSIDLINGWPGQDENILLNDLEKSTNLNIQHISNYNFILEPDAARHDEYAHLRQQTDEEGRRYWDLIEEFLENKGFIHYETSNFSLPGFPCDHNVAIWKGGEYLGLGLGAHSHLSGRRFANSDDLELYTRYSSFPEKIEVFSEQLDKREKARECAIFWLRLFEGVELREFSRRTGCDFFELYADELPALFASGALEKSATHVRVPRRFQPLLDSVLTELI